jgi:ribose transport system substrate-binding protein
MENGMKSFKPLAIASALVAAMSMNAQAAELNKIGISLGSMGNPFFVALANGAEAKAKEINPNVEVLAMGYDYDLGKQFNQIDNFIAAGVDLILLNPGDPHAIAPAIKRAQKAGITVVSVDTAAEGSDATVTTDNVSAGAVACEYIVKALNGKGNVIIQNGPQVSAVIDRVDGCKAEFAKAPGINVLSDDQDGKGSRDGGMAVMLGHLTRYNQIDAVFTINDPQAIGTNLAAKQLKRDNIIITAVDGAPDIVAALKDPATPMIQGSGSQDPYKMAQVAVEIGNKLLNGETVEQKVVLLPSQLVTRDNVDSYQGWDAVR